MRVFKTAISIRLALSVLNGVIPVGAALAEVSNPYAEGVARVSLTPAERESLLLYANNSKANLERAVREAQGKPLAEANEIYLSAIKRVVAESFQERRRSELLMRMALNQAMELTVGTPSADGKSIEKEGVLKSAGNTDLLNVILEESISLALMYYQDDRTAIESNALVQLPYYDLAQTHLRLGSEWLAGINEWSLQLVFQKTLLEQWKSTVLQEDHLTRAQIASAILDVEDALSKIERENLGTEKKVRFLRGVIHRICKGVQLPVSLARPAIYLGSFVKIPRGTFWMGTSPGDAYWNLEKLHEVTISTDFEMQTTPVTQELWVAIMGSSPSGYQNKEANCPGEFIAKPIWLCPSLPVTNVSWDDAQVFLEKLNSLLGGRYIYRLPTEAEWEYAARGGLERGRYSFGNDKVRLLDHAWLAENSGKVLHPVGSREPNAWGLYDMEGNVSQWVQDFYWGYYAELPSIDPLASERKPMPSWWSSRDTGNFRIVRGSSYYSDQKDVSVAGRGFGRQNEGSSLTGFRMVRVRVSEGARNGK